MWITRRTDYATRVLLMLALTGAGQLRTIHELAAATGAPMGVLQHLVHELRNAQLVRLERGRSGGYGLARPAREITLGAVVRLMQGPVLPLWCTDEGSWSLCDMAPGCSLQQTWGEVRDVVTTLLEDTTFEQLAARAGGAWQPVELVGIRERPDG